MSEELTIERRALAVKEDNSDSGEQTGVQTQGPSEPSSTTTTTATVAEQTTGTQATQQPNESEGATAQAGTATMESTQAATAEVVQASPQAAAVNDSASAGATPYSTSTAILGQYIQPPLTQPPPPFSVNMNVQQAKPVANPFIQLSSIFTKARAAASSIAQQATSQEARPLWVAGIIGLLGALGIFFSTQQSRGRRKKGET